MNTYIGLGKKASTYNVDPPEVIFTGKHFEHGEMCWKYAIVLYSHYQG